ncbi:hypothetical protein GQ42DRAFT_158787 [Ramicandelaber brevisporus]|nr:hypothetical protein GQ42DRAFT_158787 [Ramicandelaber brevisporus]
MSTTIEESRKAAAPAELEPLPSSRKKSDGSDGAAGSAVLNTAQRASMLANLDVEVSRRQVSLLQQCDSLRALVQKHADISHSKLPRGLADITVREFCGKYGADIQYYMRYHALYQSQSEMELPETPEALKRHQKRPPPVTPAPPKRTNLSSDKK